LPEIARRRNPGDPVSSIDLLLSPDVHWRGYWAGGLAPTGPTQHLVSIGRSDECWCWSGKSYGECCRSRELKVARERDRRLVPDFQ
jgi:hypothetical protein